MVRRYAKRGTKRPIRRRYGGKCKMFGKKRSPTGFLKMVRKLPDMAIGNQGAIIGAPTVTDPTGTCITVGPTSLSAGSTQGYDVPFSLKFQLNQLLESSDITGLCDKYKIAAVYVRAYYNKTGFAAGAQAGMPYIEHCTDHDDGSAPTVNSLRVKMGVKMSTFKNGSSYIGIKCRPTPARELYRSGITAGYEVPGKAPFINSTTPDVEHYAIKGVIHNMYLPGSNPGTEVIKFDVAFLVYGKDFQ